MLKHPHYRIDRADCHDRGARVRAAVRVAIGGCSGNSWHAACLEQVNGRSA